MSRVSREQASENRSRVVAAASSLFRRKGLDGIGIRDLMAEAGLTHGGFAGQFGSKEALAGEACAHAFADVEQALDRVGQGDAAGRLRRLTEFYLAPKIPGHDCPMSTLAGDVARAPAGASVRRTFTTGLRRLAGLFAGQPPDDHALATMAAMVGAVVLRRASDDTVLADRIDAAVLRLAGGPDAIATPSCAAPA